MLILVLVLSSVLVLALTLAPTRARARSLGRRIRVARLASWAHALALRLFTRVLGRRRAVDLLSRWGDVRVSLDELELVGDSATRKRVAEHLEDLAALGVRVVFFVTRSKHGCPTGKAHVMLFATISIVSAPSRRVDGAKLLHGLGWASDLALERHVARLEGAAAERHPTRQTPPRYRPRRIASIGPAPEVA